MLEIEETGGRYINPYTDYGFKYLFGTEPNKEERSAKGEGRNGASA